MPHPALAASNVAVVTGGASGIGLAAAKRLAGLGLNVVIADLAGVTLDAARRAVLSEAGSHRPEVLAVPTDVRRLEDLHRLHETVMHVFGRVHVLMNNAGVQPGSTVFGPADHWSKVLGVNLWGVVLGTQVFVPGMIARGAPGLIINTGSKLGITAPPGDPAYNVSKAGVKAFTESLQHELRNTPECRISAHLFIPGYVFTPLTAGGRTNQPAAAWTPEQTVDFMLCGVEAGDFYILCPDNEVDRRLDERRILWAAGDIVENRPALSRWHPDFARKFEEFARAGASEEGLPVEDLNASNDD